MEAPTTIDGYKNHLALASQVLRGIIDQTGIDLDESKVSVAVGDFSGSFKIKRMLEIWEKISE